MVTDAVPLMQYAGVVVTVAVKPGMYGITIVLVAVHPIASVMCSVYVPPGRLTVSDVATTTPVAELVHVVVMGDTPPVM